jgi:uncharacterized membrane protein YkoI
MVVSMNENNETQIQPTSDEQNMTQPRRDKKKALWIGAAAVAVLTLGGVGTAVAADGIGTDDDTLTGDTLDRATDEALRETGEGEVVDAERDDDGGYEIDVRMPDGSERDVHLNDDYTVRSVQDDADDDNDADDSSNRSDSDDADERLTGDTLDRATDAALAEAGGGEVVDAERDDDGGFEVEVRLTDGSEVDVDLNDDFSVRAVDRDDD